MDQEVLSPRSPPTPAVRTQPLTRTLSQVSQRRSGEQRARAPRAAPASPCEATLKA